MVALRLYYKHISDEIEEFIDAKDINAVKEVNDMRGYQVVDIPKLLASQYKDSLIKKVDATALAEALSPLYTKLERLQERLDQMHLNTNELLDNCVWNIEKLDNLIKEHNDNYYTNILNTNKNFFDYCLMYPLDDQQRRSIVSEEDNVLVVSSAGSGKTSSIVGKVKYLIEVKHAAPSKILLSVIRTRLQLN